jgi:hypothetical protein
VISRESGHGPDPHPRAAGAGGHQGSTPGSRACVNGGNHNPSASNKSTFKTTVTAPPQPFEADKNGNVVGTQTLAVPAASSLGFSCPNGQTTTLVSVSYTNVVITDTTSHPTITSPDRTPTPPLWHRDLKERP